MLTPAQAHLQHMQAQIASNRSDDDTGEATGYELMLVKLAADRRRLKDIQSIQEKITLKATLLPDYQPWVDGVLSAGTGRVDDVLATVMVWSIDTGDYPRALEIGAYVIEHNLPLPDQYQRSAPALLVEEIADAAKRCRDKKEPFDPAALDAALHLAIGHDMHDQIRAKAHKELGLLQTDPATALASLRTAQDLDDKVGVKKDIERLERALKNAGDQAAA